MTLEAFAQYVNSTCTQVVHDQYCPRQHAPTATPVFLNYMNKVDLVLSSIIVLALVFISSVHMVSSDFLTNQHPPVADQSHFLMGYVHVLI